MAKKVAKGVLVPLQGEVWRELNEDGGKLPTQRTQGCEKLGSRPGGIAKSAFVREFARELGREEKVRRSALGPMSADVRCRDVVERGIDLHGIQMTTEEREAIGGGKPIGVKNAPPIVEAPSAGANVNRRVSDQVWWIS